MQHCLEELQGSLRLCTLSAGTNTDQVAVCDPVGQETLLQHFLEKLQGSLRLCTLSAGTDQGSMYDPVWQEALVQHSLEELPCSQWQLSGFARLSAATRSCRSH